MQSECSSVQETTPCFLADRMVGKLARWLRLLGYDTLYWPQLSPEGVMREARRQQRIILTRDTRIPRRKDAPSFIFLAGDRFREQLKQIAVELQLDLAAHLFTRCSVCNTPLAVITKDEVRARVPEYVWQTQEEFRTCLECQRIYWGATHKQHMLEELQRLGLLVEETRRLSG